MTDTPPENGAVDAPEPTPDAEVEESSSFDDGDGIEQLLADPSLYELAAQPEPDDTVPTDTDDEPVSKREARYRTSLRDAEARLQVQSAEIAHLQDQIAAIRKAEVERIASAKLADGADVWLAGHTVDDMLGDDDTIDMAKVDAVVRGLLERRPHWGIIKPSRGQLLSGASNRPSTSTPSGFIQAFTPRRSE